MLPNTLSASSALVFEGCEARFLAENVEKAGTPSNDAADKGTVCHAVLERWIAEGYYLDPERNTWAVMKVLLLEEYYKLFAETDHMADCEEMLLNWYNRQPDWSRREVISTEEKRTFFIPSDTLATWSAEGRDTSRSDDPENKPREGIDFTYIMDRMDKVLKDDGFDVEVVDYKSIREAVKPEDLPHRIQPRAYALAAQIQFPEARGIWVTYDLLRYGTVSYRFTRDDNVATWIYLKNLVEKILASDGTRETLNQECRYCVRKSVCKTLLKHAEHGGTLGVSDLDEAIKRYAESKWALDALKGTADELAEYIKNEMEEAETSKLTTTDGGITVGIKSRSVRTFDATRVPQVIGPDLMLKYGSIKIGDIDKMLKDDSVPDATKSLLRSMIVKQKGRGWLDPKKNAQFAGED